MQTLRELLVAALDAERKTPERLSESEQLRVILYALEPYLDLTILDGVGLVAMDREAGVDAAKQAFNHVVEPVTGEIAIDLRSFTDAILTACGIIVPDDPDDVVEVIEGEVGIVEIGPPGVPYVTVRRALHPGDTIAVIRKSTLHPPVKEGE